MDPIVNESLSTGVVINLYTLAYLSILSNIFVVWITLSTEHWVTEFIGHVLTWVNSLIDNINNLSLTLANMDINSYLAIIM